jgi:hypothetical protein
MIVRIAGQILCLTALLSPVRLPVAEMRARSILVLDQSEAPAMCSDGDGNFYPPPIALKLIADRAGKPANHRGGRDIS